MSKELLFTPKDLGTGLKLNNRVVMAPLTRCMADDALVPTDLMASYYARRADTGLIISEATLISANGQGYPNTPGLFNEAQVTGWRRVTNRVHQAQGKIFAQLWHTGRVAHRHFTDGEQPIAPSPIGVEGHVPRMRELTYEQPRQATQDDIQTLIAHYAKAAANAKRAGFDGVEIHAANGYLVDQFLHYASNQRDDQWGGSPENMSRLLLKVIEAVNQEIPHVGVRLSPAAYFNMEHDPRDVAVFDYLLEQLNHQEVAYVHTGIFNDVPHDYLGGTVTQYLRRHYKGTVIASGSYSAQSGAEALERGDADLIAIGRPLIANPDYVEKVRNDTALIPYDQSMLTELV